MNYEQCYKFASDMATVFLEEEDAVAVRSDTVKTIYDDDHPAYGLFGFIYPQLFLKDARDKIVQVLSNDIRANIINRMRTKILAITALTGTDFVDKLESNMINGILSLTYKPPRALRRELRELFDKNSILWFAILVASQYNNAFIAHSAQVDKTRMTRTVAEASLSPKGQRPTAD